MASETVEAAVKSFVAAQYTAAGGTFAIKDLDNYTEDTQDATLTQFYAIDFPPVGSEERKSFGNPGSNRFEEKGSFQVHFFVRTNQGSALAKSEADKLRDAIRAKVFSGVLVDYVGPPEGGPADEKGAWYAVTVSVDFRFSTYH